MVGRTFPTTVTFALFQENVELASVNITHWRGQYYTEHHGPGVAMAREWREPFVDTWRT